MIGQLNVVDGKRQYLFDDEGRRYLDGFGGIATVGCGHCHPDVVEAIVNQTKRLQHSTVLYLNSAIADFAEALASKLPGDLNVVLFTNSGTEANELALMMAKLYTGSHDIISLRNGYHGNAAGTMGATGQSVWKYNVVQESERQRGSEEIKMQGILTRKVFSGRISLCSQPRCFSQLAQKNASLQENDVTVPKMPPFDYSPPPYNEPPPSNTNTRKIVLNSRNLNSLTNSKNQIRGIRKTER
ncbi:alanine--glyoxylate aminotransferase 2 like protein 2 [Quercus suber]|uniref:Alanine--glyoxylate aminotransferase 2 like protein 2 n=1 Tax=Quercus suber TaxID=58331 RepID=A0AAW0LTP1_QUESU